jgi:hypothetical protein
MTVISVDDLDRSEELDQQARHAVYGGSSSGQGIWNGGAVGFSSVTGGGILSPTINVQTIINTPVNIQVSNLLKQFTAIDTTTIIASVVDGLDI